MHGAALLAIGFNNTTLRFCLILTAFSLVFGCDRASEEGATSTMTSDLSDHDESDQIGQYAIVSEKATIDDLEALNGQLVSLEGILSIDKGLKDPSAVLCGVSVSPEAFLAWDGYRMAIRGKLQVIDWDAQQDVGEEELGMAGGKEYVLSEIHQITIYPPQDEDRLRAR